MQDGRYKCSNKFFILPNQIPRHHCWGARCTRQIPLKGVQSMHRAWNQPNGPQSLLAQCSNGSWGPQLPAPHQIPVWCFWGCFQQNCTPRGVFDPPTGGPAPAPPLWHPHTALLLSLLAPRAPPLTILHQIPCKVSQIHPLFYPPHQPWPGGGQRGGGAGGGEGLGPTSGATPKPMPGGGLRVAPTKYQPCGPGRLGITPLLANGIWSGGWQGGPHRPTQHHCIGGGAQWAPRCIHICRPHPCSSPGPPQRQSVPDNSQMIVCCV